MLKDPLSFLRLVWTFSLFCALLLALPSLLSGQWFEAVAKFLLVMSAVLLGVKAVLYWKARHASPESSEPQD